MDWTSIGFWGSFVAGLLLMSSSALGVSTLLGTQHGRVGNAKLLQTGLILMFLSLGLNTLYWQVFGQVAVNNGWLEVLELRFYGSYLDWFFKGSGAVGCIIASFAMTR